MTEKWVESIAAQLVAQNLGTVLNVGSSCMALLEILSQNAARRIVLTEPDPVKVQALQRQYGSNSAVTIVPAAITEAIGPVTLHRYNITQVSALRPASGLKTLFPGLLETDQIEVPTQTIEAVLQMCNLESSTEHVLILGAAGEELAVIDALIALDALHLFDHVIVPLPSHSLYEDAANGAAIRKQLESVGFQVTSQDMSDPDLLMAYMRLDRNWLALVSERQQFAEAKDAAEARISQIMSERDAAEEARRDVEQDVVDMHRILEETQKELSVQKKAAEFKDAAVTRISQLMSERDAAEEARCGVEQDVVDMRQTLEETQKELSVQKKAAEFKDAAEARISQIMSERDAAEEARRGIEQDVVDMRQALEETQKELSVQKAAAVFGDTYRHALRLELSGSQRASGATRAKLPAALKLLSALDTLPISDSKISLAAPSFNLGAFKKATDNTAERAKSHIVLDVKSVPRSGLHYMKRQFAKILQDGYSFCEWYQEPGCCKRMPCVHFPDKTQSGDGGSLRMLKSHDFDNTDPVYPVTPGMQRLILTRDPIFTLTSQWLLSLLKQNRGLLEANDIKIEKIYYLHESEVLSQAYGLLDASQTVPCKEDVTVWLEEQKAYLLAFSKKWGTAAANMPRTYIVPYDKTPLAIAQCLAPITNTLSSEQRARLETHVAQWQDGFKPRSDPFKGPTPYLTTLLQQYAPLFLDAAEFVCKMDAGGLFGTTEALTHDGFS